MPSYTNAETKIPKLLLDYVESRRSALGLPVVGTLPFLEQLSASYRTLPCVVFYAQSWKAPHRMLLHLTVNVDLIAKADDTTAANENDYVAALRFALTDWAAFDAYLSALSLGNRTGWRMNGYVVEDGGVEIDGANESRTRRTTLTIRCQATEAAH